LTTEIANVYASFVTTLRKYLLTLSLTLSFLFLSQSVSFAAAPSNGAWITVGSMATRRILATSTLLQNGKVLIAGGRPSQSEPLLASTELYDPTTKTWSTTGNLNTPRLGNNILPFMVTLQNGKALIAGGGDADETSIGSAELYDPATGTWSYTGSLNTSRRDAPVVLLNDGRVLIAGGATGFISGTIVATSELYDPATGTWSYSANNLAIPRDGPTMTKLQDGRVLIVGGNQADGTCTSSAEIFDPTTNTWSSAGTMPWGAVGITTTLLPDGRVFAAGGQCATIFANTAIYDPSTNSWAATAAMPQARVGQSSFLLSDGTVLIAGGSDLSSSIIYDPSTNTWSNGPSLTTLHNAFAISPLSNGDILAEGGWVSDPSQPSDTFANAELFTTVNPTYSITGNVFVDANHNGVQDNGEGNYQGATVTLSGASSASTTTDTNGNYTFAGLASGSYTVTLTDPTGYGSTTTNPVNLNLNSNTTENFGITTTTQVKLTPIVDTFVNSNAPTTNYGTLDKLTVQGNPIKTAYLKYDLSSLAGKTITSVKFKITTYSDANSVTAGPDYVYLANSATWGETTMNYNNQPGVSSTLLGTLTNMTSLNTQYSFQLDPTGIQSSAGSRLSIGITTGTSDQLHIYSREATNVDYTPKVVIDYY
jgi:hypothetical protein